VTSCVALLTVGAVSSYPRFAFMFCSCNLFSDSPDTSAFFPTVFFGIIRCQNLDLQ
jgi:hypothetical protein